MRKILLMVFILIFSLNKNSFAIENSYIFSSCNQEFALPNLKKIEGIVYNSQTEKKQVNVFRVKELDLNLETMEGQLLWQGFNHPIKLKLKEVVGNYIISYGRNKFKVNFDRGEINFNISDKNYVIFCEKINGKLSYYGKINNKQNKPKTVAKKPEKFERAINILPDNYVTYLKSSDYIILEIGKSFNTIIGYSNNYRKLLPESAVSHCNSLKKRTYLFGAKHKQGGLILDEYLGWGRQIYKTRFICAEDDNSARYTFNKFIKLKKIQDKKFDSMIHYNSRKFGFPNLNSNLLLVQEEFKEKTVIVKKPKPEVKPEIEKPEIKKPDVKKIIESSDVDSSLITIGSGSGFYINNRGHVLTNHHVIDTCKQSIAVIDGKETLFRIIATDKTNDVAVLKTNFKSRNYIKINEDGAKLGEDVIAVGYPLSDRLSDSVKITRGIVSSLSGMNNNIGEIQIDAAIQPGNSGGPVLNNKGELVGIASAGLNKLLMAKERKYIPENVNFAVASPIIVNILKNKKVKYSAPNIFSSTYSSTELAELGNSSTIQLFCRNTRAEYARLKKSKKYSQILLDID